MTVKKIISVCAVVLLLSFSLCLVYAETVSSEAVITSEGFSDSVLITDGNERTYSSSQGLSRVYISNENGISSIYVVFDRVPGEWILYDKETGKHFDGGQNGFLHEYIDVNKVFGHKPRYLELEFERATSIDEVYAFSSENIPDWVQIWEKPCEKADLLMFSSHADDEQLFFAGVLPYYAGERGFNVQVVYLVNHFDKHDRPHELLDGLWTVGVRNYPIISEFPDLYSMSYDEAIDVYEKEGITYRDFCEYITDCIRRFKPLVVVSHDTKGEYGHGTHLICSSAVRDSLIFAETKVYSPQSAREYGTWSVPKLYLHLYPENKITMNFDRPLDAFGGKTAFQMSQEGFRCHVSQHWMKFYKWIYGTEEEPITKATQIEEYSPCEYGLVHSSVGPDVKGGDFFENIEGYELIKTEDEVDPPMESETEDTKPIESESDETKPVESESDETKPAESESEDTKPAESESESEPADSESTDDPAESESDESDPDEVEPDESDPDESEPDESNSEESDPDESDVSDPEKNEA